MRAAHQARAGQRDDRDPRAAPEPHLSDPAPGIVEAIGERQRPRRRLRPHQLQHLGTEPDPQSKPSSILEELLAKTDAELAEIAKEYGVKKRFLEKRESLAKAIMAKAGYKVEDDSGNRRARARTPGPEQPLQNPPPTRRSPRQWQQLPQRQRRLLRRQQRRHLTRPLPRS